MTPLLRAALVVLAAAATADVVVQKGEDWEAVSRRVLGSKEAASELQALNPEVQGTPKEGAHLKLPGTDRVLAVHALSSAQSALAQAAARGKVVGPARAKFEEAERSLAGAHYRAAAEQADLAWRLVSQAPQDASHFAVEVRDDGRTRVGVQRGPPVRVEAEGATKAVSAGQGVDVEKGATPGDLFPEQEPGGLPSPELLRPAQYGKVTSAPNAQGLAPVRVAWRAVPGAQAYSVEVVPPKGSSIQALSLHVTGTEVSLPPLPAGTYRWRVRALGERNLEGLVAERTFQLLPAPLKLEVKESTWK